nr:hypothetical protein [Secundilactobacillus collinoides]
MIIWVAIGGRATLLGPVIGALVVNEFKTIISNYFPSLWYYFIGGLFILVILLFPSGFSGLKDLPHYLRTRKTLRQLGSASDTSSQEVVSNEPNTIAKPSQNFSKDIEK